MWGSMENVTGEQYFSSSLLLAKTKLYTSTEILQFLPTCCYAHSHLLLTFEQRVQRLALLYCPCSEGSGFRDISTEVLFVSISSCIFTCPLSAAPSLPEEKKREQFMSGSYRFELFGSRKNEIICIFNRSSSVTLHLLTCHWRFCALSVQVSG